MTLIPFGYGLRLPFHVAGMHGGIPLPSARPIVRLAYPERQYAERAGELAGTEAVLLANYYN